MKINQIAAYQIYDSRGYPTIEAVVTLMDGTQGYGSVPSGASTGQYEAWELRDKDCKRFQGRSVFNAIKNVNSEIARRVVGLEVFDQKSVDQSMIDLDGTKNKSRLGANAILSVSMAVANASANVQRIPLHQYLGDGDLLPLPEIQIIGGGVHANWQIDIQDFMIIPNGASSYAQCLEMVYNVYHTTGEILKSTSQYFGIADEGGYWPSFESNSLVFELIMEAVKKAGYQPEKDISISIDVAASDLYDGENYHFASEKQKFSSSALADLLISWCDKYPILSIEDPMADTDWKGWQKIYAEIGDQVQIIGDDLFTTSTERIQQGIDNNLANAVLIKPNQIGTITETLEAIKLTQKAGWLPVVSARSGETEDAFIAHLAVATNAGQMKVGSFARSERLAKWNELIRIDHQLKGKSRFLGEKIYDQVLSPTL